MGLWLRNLKLALKQEPPVTVSTRHKNISVFYVNSYWSKNDGKTRDTYGVASKIIYVYTTDLPSKQPNMMQKKFQKSTFFAFFLYDMK